MLYCVRMKSWNEIRKSATAFSKRWKNAYDEKSQAQSFLKEFFAVFGVDAVTVATFEHRVKFADGSQGYADCFWPGTILVEMKSRGKDLDAAFEQAMEYVRTMCNVANVEMLPNANSNSQLKTGNIGTGNTGNNGNIAQLPRAVVVSDFQRFRFYNLEKDNALTEFALKDLRRYVTLFGYMIGADDGGEIREQDPVNRKAAEQMARLHDAMKSVGYTGHPLEVYLVRLLFCLFAEDTGIFKPDQFSHFIKCDSSADGRDLAEKLAALFQTLDTAPETRLSILDESLAAFPYVNGGLFAESLPMAAFSAEMRKALLGCATLDWSKISPAIFGAMFQGVMDEKARHDLGAHYTSEKNILKLIRPLFLDALRDEFETITGKVSTQRHKGTEAQRNKNSESLCLCVKNNATGRGRRIALEKFHDKIASLTFLDPACGCGNFLLIAYRELRRLEMDVLEELYRDDPGQFLDISQLCKVGVSQFYGIEIEQFPAEIAKVALWLMDHLCNMEVADRFGQYFARIPIKDSPHIVCANALTMDWESLLNVANVEMLPIANSNSQLKTGNIGTGNNSTFSYIFGNPPFLGRMQKSAEQQAAIDSFFDYRDIDFVACWYAKAAEYGSARCAFVSTNSITQGEQVAPLWRTLSKYGTEIDFAYRTFKWHNEAKGNAAVHCVIIGFHAKGGNVANVEMLPITSSNSQLGTGNIGTGNTSTLAKLTKTIYDPDGTVHHVEHINGYLMPAPDVLLESRSRPRCPCAPALTMGNMPLDGGNLIIEKEEYPQFANCEPDSLTVIKRLTGSKEYIQGLERWCLWLNDVEPSVIRSMPLVMERVAKCREWRLASKSADTRKHAATPTLFREQKNPKTAIIIPSVSSEKRDYIPIGFIDDSTIVTNLAFIVPDATLYHFGILSSRMHMAWMRAVAGRLKSDYRYSKDIVYNNFIWPDVDNVANVKMLPIANSNPQLKTGNIGTGNTGNNGNITLIASAAQAVLDARAAHPNATLADLYDPLTMPPDLVKAHAHLDALVDKAYGLSPSCTDADRVAHLFKLYSKKTRGGDEDHHSR